MPLFAIPVRLHLAPSCQKMRLFGMIALTLFGDACSCQNGCQEPLVEEAWLDQDPSQFDLQERFVLAENNVSMDQREVLQPTYVESFPLGSEEQREAVEVNNRLDLFVILDESASMDDENQQYLYGQAENFLQTMTGSHLDQVDLRVKFLGAGPEGDHAELMFSGPDARSIRDDLLLTRSDDNGQTIYLYPLIRAYIRQDQGLDDDASLDDFLTNYDGPENYLVPDILGGPEFLATFGDRSTVSEWFALYARNHIDPSSTSQGQLLLSLMRYLKTHSHNGMTDFPRADSQVAVFLVTDDAETALYNFDPLASNDSISFYSYPTQDQCTEENNFGGFNDRDICIGHNYARDYIDAFAEKTGNTELRFFSLSCVDTNTSTNSNCALSSSSRPPPYKIFVEEAGGLHHELPETEVQYIEDINIFASEIDFTSDLRFALSQPAWSKSIRVQQQDTNLPSCAASSAPCFRCLNPDQDCRVVVLQGYSREQIPAGSFLDATYVPFSIDRTEAKVLSLERVPDPNTLQLSINGQALRANFDFTLDLENNTVALNSELIGIVKIRYRLAENEPVNSFLIQLRQLPEPSSLAVWIDGHRLSLCPTEAEPSDSCFRFREYTGVEILTADHQGHSWPAIGARARVLYQRIEHLPDVVMQVTPVLFLAEQPQDAHGSLAVYEIDQQGRFRPLDDQGYQYDSQRNAVTLNPAPPYGTTLMVDYASVLGTEENNATNEDLPGDWLQQVIASSAYQQACLGPNDDDSGDTVNATIQAALDDALDPSHYDFSAPEHDSIGSFRWVTGLTGVDPIKLYDSYIEAGFSETAVLESLLLTIDAERAISRGETGLAFCLSSAAAQRIPSHDQARRLAYLLGQLGRYSAQAFEDAEASAIEHLTLAKTLNTALVKIGGNPAVRLNLAFNLVELANYQEEQAEAYMAEAEGHLQKVAAQTNLGVVWDQLALFYDRYTDRSSAALDAALRAAAMSPKMPSARGLDSILYSTCHGGSLANAYDANSSQGQCVLPACELQVKLIIGVPPLVSLGVALGQCAEFIVCNLEALQCYQDCYSGSGGNSSGCMGLGTSAFGSLGDVGVFLAGALFGSAGSVSITADPSNGGFSIGGSFNVPSLSGVSLSGTLSGSLNEDGGRDLSLVITGEGDLGDFVPGGSGFVSHPVGISVDGNTGAVSIDPGSTGDLSDLLNVDLLAAVQHVNSLSGHCSP